MPQARKVLNSQNSTVFSPAEETAATSLSIFAPSCKRKRLAMRQPPVGGLSARSPWMPTATTPWPRSWRERLSARRRISHILSSWFLPPREAADKCQKAKVVLSVPAGSHHVIVRPVRGATALPRVAKRRQRQEQGYGRQYQRQIRRQVGVLTAATTAATTAASLAAAATTAAAAITAASTVAFPVVTFALAIARSLGLRGSFFHRPFIADIRPYCNSRFEMPITTPNFAPVLARLDTFHACALVGH